MTSDVYKSSALSPHIKTLSIIVKTRVWRVNEYDPSLVLGAPDTDTLGVKLSHSKFSALLNVAARRTRVTHCRVGADSPGSGGADF